MIVNKHFGRIDIDWEKAISIDAKLKLNGLQNNCDLWIEPSVSITHELSNIVDNLEMLDRKSRESFEIAVEEEDQESTVFCFIEDMKEAYEDDILEVLESTNELTYKLVADCLRLAEVRIFEDAQNNFNLVCDYTINQIAGNISDQILVVVFDLEGNIRKITWES